MADVYRELKKALDTNSYLSAMVLAAMYRREQIKEADKTPPEWNAYTVLIPPNMDTTSVLPRNPLRSGLALSNTGSGGVFYASKAFHLTTASAALTGNSQGVVEAGLIAPGGNVRIPSSGPLYVAAQGSTGSQLQVIETLYFETMKDTSLDQIMYHGYRNVPTVIEALVKELT